MHRVRKRSQNYLSLLVSVLITYGVQFIIRENYILFVWAINVHWTLSSRERLWKFFRLARLMSSKSVKLRLTSVECQSWFLKRNVIFLQKNLLVWKWHMSSSCFYGDGWAVIVVCLASLRHFSHLSDKRVRLTPVLFACFVLFCFFMWLLFNGTANKVEYIFEQNDA